jgi:hypothetical protein
LKTVLQRVELKDYLDVDAMLQNGLSLSSGLAGASLLFPAFSSQECLKALVYFEDEALRDLPGDLEERLLSAIKSVRSIPTVVLDSTSLND